MLGQQRWIGNRPRSTSSPWRTISWQVPLETVFGKRVRDRLQLEQALDLLGDPLGRLHVEHVAELRGGVVQLVDAERACGARCRTG